jgi:hypothetical protein
MNGGGGAHESTQPTGNLGGATDSAPVVLEIDSEGGIREAKQPTENMAGATDSVPVVVEVEVSSDQNGDEPEVQQTTGNLAGATSNVPVVVDTKSEISSETTGLAKPGEGEIIESEQVNGAVEDELPELSDESKGKRDDEEGERERKASKEGGRERDESEGAVGVPIKGGGDGGKVEGQGGGCHNDEGGGASEKSDLEPMTQCVNGTE